MAEKYLSVPQKRINGRSYSELLPYMYEYMYARTITDYNLSHPDNMIRVREARILHDKVLANISANNPSIQGFDNCSLTPFMTAVNDVLSERMGVDSIYASVTRSDMAVKDDPLYVQQNADFLATVRFGRVNGTQVIRGHLPISPYDTRYRDRQHIMSNGAKIAYVSIQDNNLFDFSQLDDYTRVPPISLSYDGEVVNNSFSAKRSDYTLVTDADRLGLTKLIPYMTQNEYNIAFDSLVNGQGSYIQTLSQAEQRQYVANRDRKIDNVIAMLKVLDDNGVDYSIEPDVKTGELRAKIMSGDKHIRLITLPGDEKNIGRVYMDGYIFRFQSDVKNGSTTVPFEDATPEDCANLLKIALNIPVESPNLMTVDRNGNEQGLAMVGTPGRYGSDKNTSWLSSHSSVSYKPVSVFAYRNHSFDFGEYSKTGVVKIRVEGPSTVDNPKFDDKEQAVLYLNTVIESARTQMYLAIDADGVIEQFNKFQSDPEYVPTFSEDAEIASIQQDYWDLLTGRTKSLQRPSTEADEYNRSIGDTDSIESDDIDGSRDVSDLYYVGDPIDVIRQHRDDFIDYKVGSYERGSDGLRFDPIVVAHWNLSEASNYRSIDNIVTSMKIADLPPSELKGDSYYSVSIRDRLIKYNESTATNIFSKNNSPFIRSVGNEIYKALKSRGIYINRNTGIMIDDNGIVRYQGLYSSKQKLYNNKGEFIVDPTKKVEGEIGQIFDLNPDGTFVSKFAATKNSLYVPGYEAHIVANNEGETKDVFERTRLKGYREMLFETIRYQIGMDTLKLTGYGSNSAEQIGTTTSINNMYHHLYAGKHPLDYVERMKDLGATDEFIETLIETEATRCHYGKKVKEGSTTHAYFNFIARDAYYQMNDMSRDMFFLTDCTNMAIADERSDGYFDPVHIGSEDNQGMNRQLVGTVNPDGSITPAEPDENGQPKKDALMSADFMKYASFDPADRQQMTASNIIHATSVTEPVGIAHMTLGGWNMDDAVVVSKEFADSNRMALKDGGSRPLVKGDKVSDLHGNKGVISLVVDRNMSDEEAERLGILEPVKWFRANPDLDICMAPFPAVSRFNAGTARECMDSDPIDLVSPDGVRYPKSIGKIRMIITDKSAESKTAMYDENAYLAGKGRKASSQLSWALGAQGCQAVMREIYGPNNGAMDKVREYLIACGMDIDETGHLQIGYTPHGDEQRQVFPLPDLNYKYPVPSDSARSDFDNTCYRLANESTRKKPVILANGKIDQDFLLKNILGVDSNKTPMLEGSPIDSFKTVLQSSGGMMELPFSLDYPSDGPDGNEVFVGRLRQNENGKYMLPVLSASLRSGQEIQDGSILAHDYTNRYAKIHNCGVKYSLYDEAMKSSLLTPQTKALLKEKQNALVGTAQAEYNRITQDIITRRLTGKHNVVKELIMSRSMPNSATAVAVCDPRLNIDEVAIGPDVAKTLNVDNGESIIVLRDPVWHDGGCRYMRVKVDPTITGCGLAPQMDKSFDGDFDGDTYGLIKLHTPAAIREASNLLSVNANLLDEVDVTAYDEHDKAVSNSLYMQNSLDVKVAQHFDPSLKTRWETITDRINKFERDFKDKAIDFETVKSYRNQAVRELNNYYHDAFSKTYGQGIISYASLEDHMQSTWDACITTGAKGSPSKFGKYLQQFGVECPYDDSTQTYDFSKIVDHGHTLATREDVKEVHAATAIKKAGTARAGAVEQRGMAALHNYCSNAIQKITYPVNQAVLQVKHDPVKAKRLYTMIQTSVRDLWQGHKLQYSEESHNWEPVMQKTVTRSGVVKEKPAQCTKQEWIEQVKEIYESPHGLDVKINHDHIREVADLLENFSSDPPYVADIVRDAPRMQATMDKLAYGGKFKDWVTAAYNGESLFRKEDENGRCITPLNEQYAPSVIANNIRKVTDAKILDKEVTGLKMFGKKDTREMPEQHSRYNSTDKLLDATRTGRCATVAGNNEAHQIYNDLLENLRKTGDAGDE